MKLNTVKIISLICAVLLVVPSFLGAFLYCGATPVSAAQAPERPYTPLSDKEALAFIGWLSNKSKVTDEMKSAGNIYDFLTGKLEYGSEKEVAARFAFCAFAATGINKNLEQASNEVTVTTDYLIEYLKERAEGDAGEEISEDIFKEFKNSVSGILQYYLDVDEITIANLECIKSGYTDIISAPGKGKQLAKDITAGFAAFFYIGAQNKRAQYTYVATKIKNLSSNAYSNPAVADIIDSYNSMANANNNMFAALSGSNSWNKEENKALLDTFAKFISDANESTGYSAASSTVVQVHCPTDVTVTDKDGEVIVKIRDNTVEVCAAGQFAAVKDSQKLIVLSDADDCNISVVGTDVGTMDYTVSSYNDAGLIRQVGFEDVPVSKDSLCKGTVPSDLYADVHDFCLTTERGEVISPDFDSLPNIDMDASDSVVYDEEENKFPSEVIDLLGKALYNMESFADLEKYAVAYEDLSLLFSAVSKKYPCEYNLIDKDSFKYRANILKGSMIVKSIELFYGEESDLLEYQKKVETLKEKVKSIVAPTEGMTDFEKALYLHDYIILNGQYDKDLAMLNSQGKLTGSVYTDRYTEYGMLTEGKGICGSYAMAYESLMNAAGVECIYLSSSRMNHAWNMVKIDGEWYHVDVCWDDPVPDRDGVARREYFLLNDSQIRKLDHMGWTPAKYVSDSKAFADMPRKDDTLQKYYENTWYFYENGTVYSSGADGSEKEEVLSVRLSSFDVDGSYVYYSAADSIYRYHMESKETELVYILSYDGEENIPDSASFVNLFAEGESITAYVSYYDEEESKKTVRINDTIDPERYTTVSGITLDKTELSLDVFGTATLAATIISNTGTEGLAVSWSSSDESIVSIDSLGNVTANNIGEATVTARFLDCYSECTVTVSGDGNSGTAGSGVTWSFDGESGRLTFSGSGKMENYSWESLKDQVKSVVIGEGITYIPPRAFMDYKNLESADLPKTVTKLNFAIFSGCENLTEATIPNTVTTLGSNCYNGCKKLTRVVIPDSVTIIEDHCFRVCTSLSSVVLSKNLVEIGLSDFEGCVSLQYIDIPSSVKKIYSWAFWGSGLLEIHVPDSVEYIGERAFAACSDLKTVTLGKGVKTVEHNAIYETPSLESVIVSTDNPYLTSDEKGILYNKDKTVIIKYPDGAREENVILPESLVSVGRNAFAYNKNIVSVILPDGVKDIGIDAFINCRNLRNIDFGESLEAIGDGAFCFCYSLGEISLPDTLTTLGSSAFRQCTSLVSVELGASLSKAGSNVFLDCTAIESITIPASLKLIPEYFLMGCASLSSLTMEEGIEAIGYHAFNGCASLSEVTIPESLTEIRICAFVDCTSLSEIYIPKAVTVLDASVFTGCDMLENINVSEENLHFSSLNGVLFNKKQTELILRPAKKEACYIPASVDTIDFYYAFGETDSLLQIEVDENNKSFSSVDGLLYSADKTILLCYPGARPDRVFRVPDHVKYIDYYTFSGCLNIETVIFSSPQSSLGEGFSGCPNIKNLIFEEGAYAESAYMNFEHMELVVIKNRDFVPNMYYGPYGANMTEERLPVYAHEGSAVFELESISWAGIDVVNMDSVPHEHVYYLYGHTPMTDTEDGKLVYQCYCGDEFSEIEHRFGETVAVAPSCIAGEEYRVCENCGEREVLNTYPENGIHSYAVIAYTEGDCTTPPQKTYECIFCKDSYTVVSGLASHNYEKTVVEPTCTDSGYTVSECTECGEYCVTDTVAALGHILILEEIEGGYVYSCSVCDYYYDSTQPEEEELFTLSGSIALSEPSDLSVTVTLTAKDDGGFDPLTVEASLEYAFADIPAGTYILRAETEGFYIFEEDVTIGADSVRDILLIKEGTPILGDINFDGDISAKDSNVLKRILSGEIIARAGTALFAVSDINEDTEVNAKDSNVLKRVLSGEIELNK